MVNFVKLLRLFHVVLFGEIIDIFFKFYCVSNCIVLLVV